MRKKNTQSILEMKGEHLTKCSPVQIKPVKIIVSPQTI